MTMNRRSALVAIPLAALALGAVSCSDTKTTAQKQDQQAMADIQSRMQNAQPIPALPWSQYRQTSFWFSRGAGGQGTPIGSCPSLGFPVPASAQLSNPETPIWHGDTNGSSGVTVSQMEPNGVYTGSTDGTYVVCAGTGGKPYLVYVEADVITIGGPAEWRDGKVQPTGDPTIKPGVKK